MAASAKDELLAIYLERRPALVRSFAARTGSQDRAEDIVQDIYVRLHALSDANAAEVQNPIAFLYRIGGNLVLDAVRQGKRMTARDQAWTETSGASLDGVSIADQPSPEEAAWARLKLDQVARALEGVPPKARQAFRLHRLDGLTHGQIAARLGVSTSSVEKYLSAVLARLLVEVGWP
ncbi:RNA polymerase subunit sigma-70 [Brevundimonas sp. LM2]|uniref:RNA polymerase sigma factor n=1 Tax=Brevundimonas sp. LM2 TaxID=1938605 RepID=UPI00098403F8|nr:sigma-70 family RNA polymerase sigma factor [Brevundimonas sp. LM2]AQR62483.1 RNA polymerase subunit sigma-70 [Brevundimonas sp. LM2]